MKQITSDDLRILHDELIEIFARDGAPSEATEESVAMVLQERGDAIFSDLVWNLTNLRFDAAEAKKHWKEVLTHKYLISERLGRNVGVRVAALDYFANIIHKLEQPRIIDPQILERLYMDATIDPLTGLFNRRTFKERFSGELARAKRYRKSFAIAIFDIDSFKHVNDTFGHNQGDEVLKAVAGALQGSIRESDLGARWGGEEFVLLMPETPKREAGQVAERVRRRVESTVLTPTSVTVSGGVASFPHDGDDENALFEFADKALYRAKAEGKNLVCLSLIERRAFPRLDDTLSVRIVPLAHIDGRMETVTANIGAGGLLFRYPSVIEITTEVRGEIDIEGRIAEFRGRVSRIEEIKPGLYEIAVQFLEIDPQDRELIMSYTT